MIERANVGEVAIVRLAHGKVNALDLDLVQAITSTFHQLEEDPARAVVLTGSGRAFSAGVDLSRVLDGGAEYVRVFLPALVESFLAVFRLSKPVVAAVNGHAVAGGTILVCACDQRLMSAGRIGVSELKVGVAFPVAAMEILAYAMGYPAARTAVLAGEAYDPTQAAQLGLVDEVVAESELLDRSIDTALNLADRIPADAYRHTKQQFHRGAEERIARWAPDGDAEAERLWTTAVADGRIARFMQTVASRAR